MPTTTRHLEEVRRRERSWYSYTRTYQNGILSSAVFQDDPSHECSYRLYGLVARYGDGFIVRLPERLS